MFIKKLKGFLIAEVLIASFVLTVGLTATTALIASSLKNSFDSRDTIIAVELAQEGVELVRNVRDNNFAAGGNGFAAFSNSSRHCRINYNDGFTYPDATTVTPPLDCTSAQGGTSRYTLQYSGGFYRHNNTSSERFSRDIFINYNQGQESALVRSFVYWGATRPPVNGGSSSCTVLNKCVFTEIELTNWNSL